ncbi:BTAD domain-containing putative transcriptional regulator [Streptacidiphilus alkalitolerans]
MSIADGQEVVVLQPSKPTNLLAALLVHPNSMVSTGYLQRAVWGEDQPVTAKAALHTCVLRLRRIFAKYGIATNVIDAVPGGYRIRADAETLDLVRFRELVQEGHAVADPESELYLLKEALALWHGPLLANVASQTLRRDEVPRLTEERLRAIERACDIELAFGRCRQLLVGLWEVVRNYPGHERFSEQLMEALYRTGRQTEALAEYRQVKNYLREELGIDPGPALQKLELAILRGEDLGPLAVEAPSGPVALTGPPAPAPAPPSGTGAQRAALPAIPGFTGRAADTAAITARLTSADRPGPALVLVCGAPGIGKTALALQVAHQVQKRFPDGQLVLPMTHPDGTALTSEEAARKLRGLWTGDEDAAGPPVGSGEQRVLLVFDDVVSSKQVRPLLPTGPGSSAVITSQRGLAGLVATHGGLVHRLGVFQDEESYQLLCDILGPERVEAEPDAARALAAVCGHFPIALRIVAARLLTRPRLGIADCVDWLAQDLPTRLSLADDPRMSVPSVFGRALGRLDPRLGEAFVRLGGASGRLRVEDSAAVLGVPREEAEELLERLVDVGLLEEGPPEPYLMHDLLRAYARRSAQHRGTTVLT